jgi:hypothetical protein
MYRDTTNAKHKMSPYTVKIEANRIVTKVLKEEFGLHTRKKFNRFSTKDLEHHISYAKYNSLKPEA